MSTKALIQKVRAEVEAHEQRGWLKGYEEGLAVREEETVNAQNANEKLKARIAELKAKRPAPTTARGALDLAWELAHEVKPGQVIPKGTRYLEITRSGLRERTASGDRKITPELATFRTVEPLPDPEPDWLNAPAVLATCGCRGVELWHPHSTKGGMWVSVSGENALWSTLRDVSPLYSKGQEA